MINYSEKNVFDSNKIVHKCLSYNPINNINIIENTSNSNSNNNNKNKESIIKNNENIDLYKYSELYNCNNNCFKIEKELQIIKYDYYDACLCIKKCYETFKL